MNTLFTPPAPLSWDAPPLDLPAGRPPRILIVRLSALGDVIHGLPVACALRDAIPPAEIGWVIEGRTADLLSDHPAIDHLIRVPRRWLKSPGAILDLRRRLRALRFDVVVDLQCLAKSGIAARLSGARRRIGFAGSDAREFSRYFHTESVAAAGAHVIDRYLELLRPLDLPATPVRFGLQERPADAASIDLALRELGLFGQGFALMNAGAGWPSKLWPAERYGQLARRVAATHGLASVAVWGSVAERALAEEIIEASHGTARLAPSTSIPELAALARRASLFVGSDTGPLHLAVAVGTPAISLHGTSIADFCGAYGPTNIRLQARFEAGSARRRRNATNAAMCEITVEMAAKAATQLLGKQSTRTSGSAKSA